MGCRKHCLSLEQLFQVYVCCSRNKSSSKGDSHLANRFGEKLSAMRSGCLGLKHREGSEYPCKHGRLPFDQKFRNFRNEDKWCGNFQEKFFENLGIPHEVVLFYGIMQISNFLLSASDHSELDISCKDDPHSIKETLQNLSTYMSINVQLQLNSRRKPFIKIMHPWRTSLFCIGWLGNVQRFITRVQNHCMTH